MIRYVLLGMLLMYYLTYGITLTQIGLTVGLVILNEFWIHHHWPWASYLPWGPRRR